MEMVRRDAESPVITPAQNAINHSEIMKPIFQRLILFFFGGGGREDGRKEPAFYFSVGKFFKSKDLS